MFKKNNDKLKNTKQGRQANKILLMIASLVSHNLSFLEHLFYPLVWFKLKKIPRLFQLHKKCKICLIIV